MSAEYRRAPDASATDALVSLLAAAITAALFAPTLSHAFLNWDDGANFVSNPHYRGLGRAQLAWMLTSTHLGHWIPVTWFTFGLDYVVWGMDPLGYHLTNVLLHAAAAGLFCGLARRLLVVAAPSLEGWPAQIGAMTATLSFALHPLRVESVAWVTERRDVLAAVFLMVSVRAYLNAGPSRGPARPMWRTLSLGAYALALGSKSIVMSLPVLLLVLDVYPLRRLTLRRLAWRSPATRTVLFEKIPYVLLAAATGAIALHALRAHGFLTPAHQHSFGVRLALAAYGLWFYLWRTLIPTGLSPLHELPTTISPLAPSFFGSALAVTGLSVLLWRLRHRWPAGLAAGIAYAAVLLPVSVRIHSGHQLVADRYSYFACLGWALALGGITAALAAGAWPGIRPRVQQVVLSSVALGIAGLALLTTQQSAAWRDSESLWRHAVDVDPACANCRNGLGKVLATTGRIEAAIEQFERGLDARPDHGAMTLNLVDALLLQGRAAEAAIRLRPVVDRYPEDNEVRSRLVLALIEQGRTTEATDQLDRIFHSNPTSPVSFLNVGFALMKLDRPHDAVSSLEHAVRLDPSSADAHFWLARAYLHAGDRAAARAAAAATRSLSPPLADWIDTALREDVAWPR